MKTKTTFSKLIKIFFILFFSCCLFSSCDKKSGFFVTTRVVNGESIKSGYEIIEIDCCEYIYYSEAHGYPGFGFLSHKGNCKNTIHYQNRVTDIDTAEYQLIRK